MKKKIIFGTGSVAKQILNNIEDVVAYCVDNNKDRWGEYFYQVKVLSPNELLNEQKDEIMILVASSFYIEISEQLEQMGFVKNIHFINYLEDKNSYESGQVSYSQEGEDLLLKRIYGNKKGGFYVDIGAHHPIRFSNTYLFYKEGWNGINIDPMPGMKKIFELIRPRDINLELGVSVNEGPMKYHMFDEPALNTLQESISDKLSQATNFNKIGSITIDSVPLSKILKKYASGRSIDFMSIDTEGFDLQVLLSNEWDLFRPQHIVVEILETDLENVRSSPIHTFLEGQQYRIHSKLFNSYLYRSIL